MSFTDNKNLSKIFQKKPSKYGNSKNNQSNNIPLFKNFSNEGLDEYNYMSLEKRKNTYHERKDKNKMREDLDSSEVEKYSPSQYRGSKKHAMIVGNSAFSDIHQNLSKNQYRASLPEKFTPE